MGLIIFFIVFLILVYYCNYCVDQGNWSSCVRRIFLEKFLVDGLRRQVIKEIGSDFGEKKKIKIIEIFIWEGQVDKKIEFIRIVKIKN